MRRNGDESDGAALIGVYDLVEPIGSEMPSTSPVADQTPHSSAELEKTNGRPRSRDPAQRLRDSALRQSRGAAVAQGQCSQYYFVREGRFYTELFDWKLNEIGGPSEYATVDTGGGEGAIGGGLGGAPDGFEGHVTFYVNVDDVGSALQRAEELGGTSVMGPHRIDGPETGPEPFEIGMFRDPEGRMIGLHSRLD